jgi:hypothetical protein
LTAHLKQSLTDGNSGPKPSVRAADRLNVVASFSILGDFVRNVGGDRVDVTTLVGPDSDAHVYAPLHASDKRIFKEGRKFGVGALVISQRPSEISETILAQIGTLIALRLTNSGDQSIVKSSSPDNLNSLIDLLPSLRIGAAVIVGESVKIPSRIRVKLNNPRPTSEDPNLVECWTKQHKISDENYKTVVTKIREQKL